MASSSLGSSPRTMCPPPRARSLARMMWAWTKEGMAAVVARLDVQHPQRVPLGGPPAVWCSGAPSRSLSTNTQASWKMCSVVWPDWTAPSAIRLRRHRKRHGLPPGRSVLRPSRTTSLDLALAERRAGGNIDSQGPWLRSDRALRPLLADEWIQDEF